MKRQSKTCIALIKNRRGRLIMAGDRRVSSDWSFAYKCPRPKITKTWNNILIGASGSSDLCKLIIDIFEPPKIEPQILDLYMYYSFKTELLKLLKAHKYIDEHNLLRFRSEDECSILIGIKKTGFLIDLLGGYNPDIMVEPSIISLDDAPIPYVIGCGAASAYPILLDEYNTLGYNTKETLEKAMLVASQISPGCDNEIDYRYE